MRLVAAAFCALVIGCSAGSRQAPAVEEATPQVGPGIAEATAAEPAPPPSPPRQEVPGRVVDSTTLRTIIECWFESPYGPMFEHSRPVTVGDQSFGMLMAGISGILYYGDLNTCAGRISGTPPRSYSDDRPFEALSGLPLHSERMSESQPFGFFNPALVDWGRRNLVPDPQTSIGGVTAQQIYERVFSRFFRMMTEAYLELRSSGSYQQQMDDYWQMATGPDQDGIDWLQGRYAGALPAFAAGADGTTMTPQMAIGFWLRRGIDGTSDALWRALREAMARFDGQWYGELRSRYTAGDIEW